MKRLVHKKSAVVCSFALATLVVLAACGSAEDARGPSVTPPASTTDEPDTPPPPSPTAAPVTPTKSPADGGDARADDGCERASASHECGVTPQCGCAPTHTCDVVDTSGGTRCITAGNAPMGHPCTATAGCALGLACVFGTCHAFCDEPTKACALPGTGACVQVVDPSEGPIRGLAVCRVGCELHDPTTCGGVTNAGVGVCYVDDEGETDCQDGGPREENQSCSDSQACGPGLACVVVSSSLVCKRWCRVGQSDCDAEAACVGFATEVKVRGVTYGVCR